MSINSDIVHERLTRLAGDFGREVYLTRLKSLIAQT